MIETNHRLSPQTSPVPQRDTIEHAQYHVPDMEVVWKKSYKKAREERFPIERGMEPVKLLWYKSKLTSAWTNQKTMQFEKSNTAFDWTTPK